MGWANPERCHVRRLRQVQAAMAAGEAPAVRGVCDTELEGDRNGVPGGHVVQGEVEEGVGEDEPESSGVRAPTGIDGVGVSEGLRGDWEEVRRVGASIAGAAWGRGPGVRLGLGRVGVRVGPEWGQDVGDLAGNVASVDWRAAGDRRVRIWDHFFMAQGPGQNSFFVQLLIIIESPRIILMEIILKQINVVLYELIINEAQFA